MMTPATLWMFGLGPKPEQGLTVAPLPVFEKVYPVHKYSHEVTPRKGCSWCPECGCPRTTNHDWLGDGFRMCADCGQEWWTHITYDKQHPRID